MVTTTRTKVSKERYDASAMRSGILRAERETPEYAEARIAYPDDERYEEFKRELPEPDYTGAQEHRTRYESDYAEPAARHYREEDFMPTIRTMRQLNRAPERVVEKERVQERAKRADPAKAGKLSATTKMMIAVYALILVAVAILIIAASVAAAKRGEDAAALQAQSAALETTLQNQEREISGLLDISANDPQFSDYESAGAGKTFELKPLKNETAYEPIRGWFDRLCDFFSN